MDGACGFCLSHSCTTVGCFWSCLVAIPSDKRNMRFKTDKIASGHRVWKQGDEARVIDNLPWREMVVEHTLSGMVYVCGDDEVETVI